MKKKDNVFVDKQFHLSLYDFFQLVLEIFNKKFENGKISTFSHYEA